MYCGHCGTKCEDDARFCGVCGSPLERNIPVGGNIPAGANNGACGNAPVARTTQIAGNQNIPSHPVTPMASVNAKRQSKAPIIATIVGAVVAVVLVFVLFGNKSGGSYSSEQVVKNFMKAITEDYNKDDAINCFPKEFRDKYYNVFYDEMEALDSINESVKEEFGSSLKTEYSIESDYVCDIDEIYYFNNVVEDITIPDELHQVTVRLWYHYGYSRNSEELDSYEFDVYTGRYGNQWYIIAFD